MNQVPVDNKMATASSGRTIFTQLRDFAAFRGKRLYNTFYYGQYSGKFALVFLFPGVLCAIRYRAETKFGYNVFVTDEEIEPKPHPPKWIPAKALGLEKYFAWKNGSKFYCDEDTTVSALKKRIFNGSVPEDVAVGCKGRMFEDSDNLALAVRAFCKLDPKLLIWKEDWKQQLVSNLS